MKKQRKRIYTALLCTCFLFSTASVPVSAAETEQEEEMTTLSSRSGGTEVSTKEALTSALVDSNISKITLEKDIDINDALTVNRAVKLDLNGFVLRMTGEDSVIKVGQGGELTIADSNKDKTHKFAQNTAGLSAGLWELVDDSSTTSKTVNGGIITGGKAQKGGGVYVAPGGKLHMTGGSIVGCQASKDGGGVYLDDDSQTDASSEFTMTDSSIIGCTASGHGGGVAVNPACKFTMDNDSEIRSCTARLGGGVYTNNSDTNRKGVFTLRNGAILSCTADTSGFLFSQGGGVYNSGAFIMEGGTIKGCTAIKERPTGGVLNRREFTMSGGMIGESENDESHVYNDAITAAVFTISGDATIYTNVANDSRLNADGGKVFGEVTNAVKNWSSAVIAGTEGVAGSTEFKGKVTNNCIIEKGQFTGDVTNDGGGTIKGGVFTGSVTNNLGTILGGDFSKASLSGELVITFDPNNGGNSSKQKVDWSKEGTPLEVPTTEPTKEGHTFEGWYYDNNGVNTKWDFKTDRARYTMTLKAKWEANTYNVTVKDDGNGTASADPAPAKMGAEVSLTATPNSGYHFKKWEVVPDKVKIENNKFTMPAAHVTVKAIFERNTSSGGSGGGGGGTTYYTLTFETNGGDSIQAIRAARGKTLDLSAYTPMRDGYDFGGWYADKDLTQRITEIKLSGSKTVYADWKKREPDEPDAVKNPFADVNAGDWFYRDVLFSYEKGLMSGMDAAAFAPYANTTRAQIAVIFYRMEGSPAVEGENSFTDVVRGSGTAWFYDAVTWAQQNGIMGGYDNSSFAPNDPITREQLAAIFYRYAQYKSYDTTQGGMAIREFGDYESISDYAMGAMAWAVNTGLVKGDSNLLYPNGTATRAEIAAMLHRFVENGMK